MIRVRNAPRSLLFQRLILVVVLVSLVAVLWLRSPVRHFSQTPTTSRPVQATQMKEVKSTPTPTSKISEDVELAVKRVCIHEKLLHIRFTEFAKIAAEEGLKELAHIFTDIANNEKAHHIIFENFLGTTCNASRTNKTTTSSADNLKWAIDIKTDRIETYPQYAKLAEDEGSPEAKDLFIQIAAIEQQHLGLLKEIEQKVFAETSAKWVCQNCGYIHYGTSEPKQCPLCKGKKFVEKT